LFHAYRAKDKLGQLIVVGAVASFFWPAVINLGMVLGLFPVVGIPAPFLSYGGSSLMATMLALGLVGGGEHAPLCVPVRLIRPDRR
jgi:cell division protein FtsW (lipid II flippase)